MTEGFVIKLLSVPGKPNLVLALSDERTKQYLRRSTMLIPKLTPRKKRYSGNRARSVTTDN